MPLGLTAVISPPLLLLVLLQAPAVALSKASTSDGSQSEIQPADWFADFDHLQSGVQPPVWEPGRSFPFRKAFRASRPPRWFHEAASGGHDASYQTHYPALEKSRRGFRPKKAGGSGDGYWRQTQQGWQLDFRQTKAKMPRHQVGPKPAVWFDPSTVAVDVYGRRAPPPQFHKVSLAANDMSNSSTPTQQKSKNSALVGQNRWKLRQVAQKDKGKNQETAPAVWKNDKPIPNRQRSTNIAKAANNEIVQSKLEHFDDRLSGSDASLEKMVDSAFHPIIFNKQLGKHATHLGKKKRRQTQF